METGHASSPRVVVSYHADPDERSVLADQLEPRAELTYLEDTLPAERRAVLRTVQVLLTLFPGRELTQEEFGDLPALRLVQTISAGVDQLPFARFPPGVVVCSNAGAYADPMAEHVLAMILELAKRLCAESAKLAAGVFDRGATSRRLRGSTAAIVGFGGIGQASAKLLRACGVRIIALNTSGTTEEPVAWVGTLSDLERALGEADIVVLSLPLSGRTRGLIGARQLGWMKDEAILINVARGALIDEAALYKHLRAHPAFQAGIDTWWNEPRDGSAFSPAFPFLEMPNVLGSPHNSGNVAGIYVEAVARAAANILRFLGGEPVRGKVAREDYES
jgi:phosphoglycerate dehydrogenase-like enzyme